MYYLCYQLDNEIIYNRHAQGKTAKEVLQTKAENGAQCTKNTLNFSQMQAIKNTGR